MIPCGAAVLFTPEGSPTQRGIVLGYAAGHTTWGGTVYLIQFAHSQHMVIEEFLTILDPARAAASYSSETGHG